MLVFNGVYVCIIYTYLFKMLNDLMSIRPVTPDVACDCFRTCSAAMLMAAASNSAALLGSTSAPVDPKLVENAATQRNVDPC